MTQLSHNQHYALGLRELTYVDYSRTCDGQPRKLEVALWYPTPDTTPLEKMPDETWKIKDVIKNASFPTYTKLPLIIFSHGYSSNQWHNSWFAENFAANGYIVASVRHYGNSMPNMIPELCVRPWERPQDMSFVLDELLRSDYAEYIDTNHIGAAGFSQGGIACFWLAGARAHLTPENIKQQMVMINNPELRSFHFKNIPSDRLDTILDNFTTQDFEDANQSYYDARFKAVFAMAPGIDDKNIMFTECGLAQVKTPTYIITGESDEGTIEQTPFFAHNIPYCTCTILSGKVTHWTLLNEATEQGKLNRPSRTVDHPSINREEVHEVVVLEALMFFNKNVGTNR